MEILANIRKPSSSTVQTPDGPRPQLSSRCSVRNSSEIRLQSGGHRQALADNVIVPNSNEFKGFQLQKDRKSVSEAGSTAFKHC